VAASSLSISGVRVGPGNPCLVIAEAGVNHNGQLELAHQLVDAAADAGANAVKFQTFRADRLATATAPKAAYQQAHTGAGQSQRDMLRSLELAAPAYAELQQHAHERGLLFLSTPFDEESADLLESLAVPAFKVPSGELTNLPFLAHLARKGKPLIVSTGMSGLGEVEAAVQTIDENGAPSLVLLHCVSNYPANPADSNLRVMATLSAAFGVPTGYSDHTLGIVVPLAAVALGACVIEKHFTLDRSLPGPDHQASSEPGELARLVAGIRTVESALGDGRKRAVAAEADTAAVARRSLVAAIDIPAGSMLTPDVIALRRPGTGLPPSLQRFLIGRKATAAIPAGTLLRLEMVA
jgi:N,N'-diacetyllegionaminate synthase